MLRHLSASKHLASFRHEGALSSICRTCATYELTPVTMPALSPTMESGNVISWSLDIGQPVGAGEVLCEIETDKAVVDYEMQDDAILAQILAPAGTKDLPVGTLLAYTVEDEDAYALYCAAVASTASSVVPSVQEIATPASKDDASISSSTSSSTPPRTRQPLIRFLGKRSILPTPSVTSPLSSVPPQASSQVVNLERTTDKRSTRESSSSSHALFDDIPLTAMRRIIATRLTESKATVPHAYAATSVTLNALMALRKSQKAAGLKPLSVNTYVLKAVAMALEEVPECHQMWDATLQQPMPCDPTHLSTYSLPRRIDLSVAVATSAGLITPIITDASVKSLEAIQEDFMGLVARARASKLKPAEYQGGHFTISNLGGSGIESFTAVINPPQACILAVGGSVVSLTAEMTPRTSMTVTLSYDRRVVNDVLASRWLSAFSKALESPQGL